MSNQTTAAEVFGKLRDEILKRQLSNTENYDKAVLSMSSAFLGFSLAFMKDFVPFQQAIYMWLLPTSWALFGASIFFTIASFISSQMGLSRQMNYAEKYYFGNDESYLNKRNIPSECTDIFNLISAVAFVGGVILTISFTSFNLKKGEIMTNKTTGTFDGASIPGMLQKGASIPSMQPVVPLGAQIPPMQQVNQPPAPPASTPNQENSK